MSDELMTIREALAKLADAATTGREIADRLHAQGVRGLPGMSATCPLAVYLQHATGRVVDVDEDEWHDFAALDSGPLPDVLRDFVRGVDNDRYPELAPEDAA